MTDTTQTIIIDAADRPIGRLASEVAGYVRGKRSTSFAPHKIPAVRVIIQNIDQVRVDEKKLSENQKWRNTGYPGGMRSRSWRELFAHGPEVLFMTILKNMLPAHSLRPTMLKRITFEKK